MVTWMIRKQKRKISIGFIGEGFVLDQVQQICNKRGYSTIHYTNFESIRCTLLFALRLKKIIPESILKNIPRGVIIIHFGALPEYRGYYPINQAIRNGEKEIGITMFYADKGIDTGDIIDQKIIAIDDNSTVDEIYQKCNSVAVDMFSNNIEALLDGTVQRIKQSGYGTLYRREDLHNKIESIGDIRKLHNFIRSLTGKDQERAFIENDEYKLYFEKTTLLRKSG
jgi:methionyl-tRNA formyltransferase